MDINNGLQFENMTESEAKEFKKVLTKFIKAYSSKEDYITDEEWLEQQFSIELPEVTETQAKEMAIDTIAAIQEFDWNLKSVNEAAKKGVNKEQWLANKIANAATGISIIQHGEYLNQINNALTNANAQMLRTVTTKAGEISQCNNLDGFIAEQFHVNTFNANAALSKSKYVAEVKVPEAGQTYGKNSIDIVIKDLTTGKATPIHQYQVKYGANASETIKLLREHGDVTKYPNQQIVVPPDQVAEVQKAFPGKSVVSQIGGTDKVPITSNTLSKEQAKELQLKTQNESQVPLTDWNSFKTKELALQIGKNAGMAGVQAAAITTGFALAEQVIKGEGVDVEETVSLALETGVDSGIKAATAGALKVGVEKGIISIIPKGTPIGVIANIACIGIENVKILYKVAIGELTMSQALDQMGRTSVSMVYGLGWGVAGAGIGVAALSWVPIVGPAVGGLIGGMVGYMAGSKFGQGVYSGIKAVGKGVVTVCKSAWNGIKSAGNKIRKLIFG